MSTEEGCYKVGIGQLIFHRLSELAHPVSATLLFGDNLNAELKELDDSKKVPITKKRFFSSQK